MAEKFANFRWVKEGYLDNRQQGSVIGQMTFAAIGEVPFYLDGDCTGEIFGKLFQFHNTKFLDDRMADDQLADFDIPQVGRVSLISFDPHPLLEPHPYIEWFSLRGHHYRIELLAEDVLIVAEEDAREFNAQSERIRTSLQSQFVISKDVGSEQDWC